MEKLQGFATETKYNYAVSGMEIQSEYQEKRGDVYEQVESLRISKRIGSTGDTSLQSFLFPGLDQDCSYANGPKKQYHYERTFKGDYKCIYNFYRIWIQKTTSSASPRLIKCRVEEDASSSSRKCWCQAHGYYRVCNGCSTTALFPGFQSTGCSCCSYKAATSTASTSEAEAYGTTAYLCYCHV